MTETAAAQPQTVIPGGGPGAGYASKSGIVILVIFFCLLAMGWLSLLVWLWPESEPTSDWTSVTAATPPAVEKPSPEITPATQHANNKIKPPTDNAAKPRGGTPPPPKDNKPPKPEAPPTETELTIKGISPAYNDPQGGTLALISGSGFTNTVKVDFGGIQATEVAIVCKELIRVKVPAHAEGIVDVSVKDGDKIKELSQGFAYRNSLKQRSVLLLVLLAGALGGTLYSLISLSWYVGNRDLKWSWVPSYLVRPVTASALACIFFLTLVAGVWTGQAGKNQLWIVGLSALVGLFSKQGYEKLKAIFEAALTPAPKGADAPKTLPASSFGIDRNSGPVNGGEIVQITGSGFTAATTVQFGTVAANAIRVDSPAVLQVVVPRQAAPGQVDVTVTNPGNPSEIRSVKYTYT